jgi:hypothetical protein
MGERALPSLIPKPALLRPQGGVQRDNEGWCRTGFHIAAAGPNRLYMQSSCGVGPRLRGRSVPLQREARKRPMTRCRCGLRTPGRRYKQIDAIECELRRLGAEHGYLQLLMSAPGIGWVLGYTIAAEGLAGEDVTLCYLSGLRPLSSLATAVGRTRLFGAYSALFRVLRRVPRRAATLHAPHV